ncbi:hypothetical protein ACHAXR_000299 [Thalassiosira sp. AJA248-18]
MILALNMRASDMQSTSFKPSRMSTQWRWIGRGEYITALNWGGVIRNILPTLPCQLTSANNLSAMHTPLPSANNTRPMPPARLFLVEQHSSYPPPPSMTPPPLMRRARKRCSRSSEASYIMGVQWT